MERGIFYAVGVGIGDPMDMTLRAKQILETADAVLIPVKKSGEASVAFQIARQAADMSRAEKIEVVFPMVAAKDYKEYLSGNVLYRVRECLDSGQNVAMVTLGDVSVYSTATYVRQVLEKDGFKTKAVAGIPSFSTAAARAGISLCENEESLTVLPGVSSEEVLASALDRFDNIVIMKAGKTLKWIVPFLKKRELSDKTVMFCNVGLENEYIGPVRTDLDSYFITLIIKHGGIK